MSEFKTIGEVARASGVKVNTIRFYEERGLLPPPIRSDANRRLYDNAAIARLRFIKHSRDLGFELPDISELLTLQDGQGNPPSEAHAEVHAIAARHLAAVDARIAALTSLRSELSRMVRACEGEGVTDCAVIESLGDHSQCNTSHARLPMAANLSQGSD